MQLLADLAKNYNNFKYPMADFKIDEKPVDTTSLFINDIVCDITTDMGASTCTMKIVGGNTEYASSKTEIVPDKNLEAFKLGAKLELSLGYIVNKKPVVKPVFMGFITKISIDYAGKDKLTYFIECMDVKELMMHNVSSATFNVKKSSEVLAEALKPYESYFKKSNIEDSKDEITAPISHGLCSDYSFIANMAEKLNYLFFVSKDEIHLKKASSFKEKAFQLEAGYYLMSFSRSMDLHDQVKKVTVLSMANDGGEEIVSGTAQDFETIGNGEKTISQITNVMKDFMEVTIVDHAAKTPDLADARAKAELEKISMDFVKGEFRTVGIPEFEVGTIVTFKKLSKEFDKEYLITRVRHELSHDGYISVCEFRGNKL